MTWTAMIRFPERGKDGVMTIEYVAPDGTIFRDNETIRLTKDGVFLSNGEEITHERTVSAYHRFLGKDEDGYFIAIGRDHKRIEVEDTARFVREIEWKGSGADEWIELSLADGSQERLDPRTLLYRPDRLVCRVKEVSEEAKFLRKPYLELLLRALQDGPRYSIRIGGETFTLEE
jgi:hypothetical protein